LRYHHQSNGPTERLVRTIKTGITKYGTENDRRTWDEWLRYLVMGYRMSNQHRKKPRLPGIRRKVPTALHSIGTAHAAPEVPELFYA
jgi:hypothetical protein